MEKHTTNNSTSLSLGVPKQMAISLVCRGAQSGWHQLQNAISALSIDPHFAVAFKHSFANQDGALLGSRSEILDKLATNPRYITQADAPSDVFSKSVWLTMKTYYASKAIKASLTTISNLNNGQYQPSEFGVIISDVLAGNSGLTAQANTIVTICNDFSSYLNSINGNLKNVTSDYNQACLNITHISPSLNPKNMMSSISLYATSLQNTNQVMQQLAVMENTAAKITCFSVIENMTKAVDSLSNAWKTVAEQFDKLSKVEAKRLGTSDYLANELDIDGAIKAWDNFTNVLQKFIMTGITLR